ncbi:glycerate kinase [Dyadobacter chenwenxiniae]|uniref:Glycerate kinase n=1 Tax=Dyadobacter chenwenxiniae TaxID=2906456 RepID=A0A9X1PGC8_9BACT|nr:glycerate kinase [Dyadobacter chenwenxiniae]MCF0060862.1 glycerate kinase [Dyadobacter chenwenxiniae]UON80689.1 glycerate kinase [Dyadobacter chenwenxiniae]
MNILVAPDKFRGSLEAIDVCQAVKEGILLAYPNANVTTIPLADGGEGTAQILTQQAQGETIKVAASDPLGRPITSSYGLSGDWQTAFIEMAAASGLALLSKEERNPLLTSTYGTGQLIKDALDRGVTQIILGIGGSATTDGGIGMAEALGFRFYDKNDVLLSPKGESMHDITRIDSSEKDSRLNAVSITVACDVTNPLYGPNGASHIYGPQKGADPEMVEILDNGLKNLSKIASKTFEKDISENPGAGAAGGLGAGCLWFLNAVLKDGVSIVIEQTHIAERIQKADLVITGEGKVDEQTLSGKVVKGLADFCNMNKVPLAVVCGTLQITPEQVRNAGITYAVSVLNRPMDLNQAEAEAFGLVRDATFHLVRLFFSNR